MNKIEDAMPQEFIISEIDKLSLQFPALIFKYGYDKFGEQHLIDVTPDSEYRNEAYMFAEFDVVEKFITNFPDEELLFVSEDKYIKIENPIYTSDRTNR